ncbi:MAG: hypothetical protein HY924_11140 [Elusimicrobia bacterium]|nr:hypothetical protein [Elusimicrobiota bacterium]
MTILALAISLVVPVSLISAQTIKTVPAGVSAGAVPRPGLPALSSVSPLQLGPAVPSLSAPAPSLALSWSPAPEVPQDASAKVAGISQAVEADLAGLKDAQNIPGESASASGEAVLRALTGEKAAGTSNKTVSVPEAEGQASGVSAALVPAVPLPAGQASLSVEAAMGASRAESPRTWKDDLRSLAVTAAAAAGIIGYLVGLAWLLAWMFSPIVNVPIDPSGVDPISDFFR